MSADLLALLDSDPAAGILAVADRREQGATEAAVPRDAMTLSAEPAYLRFIAAEANPDHVLAAVRRWRGVAERHGHRVWFHAGDDECDYCSEPWPCPDLTETADEARAYLGGAA